MKNNRLSCKFLSFVLIFALACTLFPGERAAAKEETIYIHSTEDFLSFAKECSLDSWSRDKEVLLEADIDLSGTDFESVPVFTGVFDGQNHTISGFRYDGDGYVAGLFRYIGKNGLIKNLKVNGELLTSGEQECIGGIAGVNYGTIQNCSFSGTAGGKTTVGGLVGVNEGTGIVQDCISGGHITGYYSTGGIAGTNHGSLLRCTNHACINNDSEWVEEDDEMGTGIFFSISVGDSQTELFSGVDAGGIAGYSDGVITGCRNYGTVGYEHTGYNIGGIAGRQCGLLSLCSNSGTVYGRKDIGGIVGQMEPYIEVNEAQSLRSAVNRLHDLIEKTIDDMEAGKNASKRDLDNLAAYSDGAADAGNALAGQLEAFVDNNMNQTQALTDRLRHASEMLPPIFDSVHNAQNSYGQAGESIQSVIDELKKMDSPENAKKLEDAVLRQQEASEKVSAAMQAILDSSNVTAEQLAELERSLEEMSDASYALLQDLNDILQTSGALPNIGNDLSTSVKHLQDSTDSLKTALQDTKSIANYADGQPDIRFSTLGAEFSGNRENLHQQLKKMSDSLQNLSDDASACTDQINDDLRAVNDQVNLVFHLLADSLTNYSEFDVEELYEDVDIEDTDSMTTGKTDNCTNRGIVQGDINVGGIAGAMSIDEEDPEDNAAGNINYQPGKKYYTRCVITNSVNEGYITAKKDGVGGIAGYMKHGAIIDSEGYGSVESTEGSYAGGICGESLTVIRHCFALCSVSGSKNVGGIAGFADTLKNCYAMADCTADAGRKGAIAGQIVSYDSAMNEEEVKVSDNYYVSDTLRGIDSISYAGVAEPVTYEQLLSVTELPAAFRHLKVIFRIEDSYLGEQELAYGESLSALHCPDIPEKEGYYGVWPDYSDKVMTGNLLITGEYRENVTVVTSDETNEEKTADGFEKPYALVEQRFTEDTVLNVSPGDTAPPEKASGRQSVVYDISLENAGIDESDSFAVRLYNPYDSNATVWGYQNGTWEELESKVRGHYLQVDMTGTKQTFCVIEQTTDTRLIALCTAACALLVLLLILLFRKGKKDGKHTEKHR